MITFGYYQSSILVSTTRNHVEVKSWIYIRANTTRDASGRKTKTIPHKNEPFCQINLHEIH